MIDCFSEETPLNGFTYLDELANDQYCGVMSKQQESTYNGSVRRMFIELMNRKIKNPVVLITDSNWQTPDEHLIHFATETGALLLDGFGDGICLGMTAKSYKQLASSFDQVNASGRNYLSNRQLSNSSIIRPSVFYRQPEQEYQKQNISVVPVAAVLYLICRKQRQRSVQ